MHKVDITLIIPMVYIAEFSIRNLIALIMEEVKGKILNNLITKFLALNKIFFVV